MSEDLFSEYMPHIRRRWQEEQAGWERRRQQAWGLARLAAQLLRQRYSAVTILAFGSLVHTGPYDTRSDIDLAVKGIPATDFFRVYGEILSLSSDFSIDLVDLADCSEDLRQVILREGVVL